MEREWGLEESKVGERMGREGSKVGEGVEGEETRLEREWKERRAMLRRE